MTKKKFLLEFLQESTETEKKNTKKHKKTSGPN